MKAFNRFMRLQRLWLSAIVSCFAFFAALTAQAREGSAIESRSAPLAQPDERPDQRQDTRVSGRAFLSADLLKQQNDPAASPIGLWVERGANAWTQANGGKACSACHGLVQEGQPLASAAARYPRLDAPSGRLINLEDQIQTCRVRNGRPSSTSEDEEVLALSAWLHARAQTQPIAVQRPDDERGRQLWTQSLERGARAYGQRIGRMNLACVHCHDQSVGRQLRAEVISPGHPTGFPVYRLRWQTLGTLERRLRACFSGVQAEVPPPGDALLRDLELFMKVRAQGMPLEGPSIRR